MFQRNAQPASSSTAAPQLNFTDDVEDLVAENLLSSQRAAKLLHKASKAGIQDISKKTRRFAGRNQARDISRKKLKYSKWYEPYTFECRVKHKRTKAETTAKLSCLLIHEVLKVLWDLGLPDALLKEEGLDSVGKKHMQWMREHLQVEQLLGFGLHGDGVPSNYDRTESTIMISLNLPGLPGKNGRMRIPLSVLPDWCVGHNTLDDIFKVFAWSMRHLLVDSYPIARHDGAPWLRSDSKRRLRTGSLGFYACVNQVRGDWDWMAKCFHFPYHNVQAGCCWRCTCRRNQVPQIANLNRQLCMRTTASSSMNEDNVILMDEGDSHHASMLVDGLSVLSH